MKAPDRWDSLIQYHTAKRWPECDWRWIKAMVAAESSFDPRATSHCGARGLMQVMPGTFGDLQAAYLEQLQGSLYNPETCLAAGILYLREQYAALTAIRDHFERRLFATASYNCGRGYVLKAMRLAEDGGREYGRQSWAVVRTYLSLPSCTVAGRRPDYRQTRDYVDRVLRYHGEYRMGWLARRLGRSIPRCHA